MVVVHTHRGSAKNSLDAPRGHADSQKTSRDVQRDELLGGVGAYVHGGNAKACGSWMHQLAAKEYGDWAYGGTKYR